MYDPVMIQPMRDELTRVGFKELKTAEDVDAALDKKDETTLVFVNSVCGCAAGVARPGLVESLKNRILPKNLTTTFAGNDVEATVRARERFVGYPPSSPCAALFREGQLVHMVERHQIEGQSAETVARVLTSAYNRYCGQEIDESVEIYDPVAELQISVGEARERIAANADLTLLDVREPDEIEAQGKIEGAVMADNTLGQKIVNGWSRDREIIVYCEHGNRSQQAVQFLRNQGFNNTRSLAGGFSLWSSS